MIKIGQGIDVHALYDNGQAEQFVTLGGVKIPHSHSLKAHSDGDVVLHALADAMLGALAMGDIGEHFPDTDEAHSGLDSRILLKHVYQLILNKGYQLANADMTIICERPKISPYKQAMRAIIAEDLQTDIDNISVKATTSEKMGFTGRKEGIMVSAVVLLQKVDN